MGNKEMKIQITERRVIKQFKNQNITIGTGQTHLAITTNPKQIVYVNYKTFCQKKLKIYQEWQDSELRDNP